MTIPYLIKTDGPYKRLYTSWLEKSAKNAEPIERHVFSVHYRNDKDEEYVKWDFLELVKRNMNNGMFVKWNIGNGRHYHAILTP